MRHLSFLVTIPVVLGLSAPVQAATVFSENFNELTPRLTATSVGGFSTVGGTNVDILGGALFGSLCAAPESGNCVDMDGTGGLPEGILQTNTAITLNPGVDYFLSFDLIGSGRGVTTMTTVTFGPYSRTFDLTSSDVTSGIVTNQLVTVSSPTAANLTFTSGTPGDIGALLDNVVITSSSVTTIPEPSSLMPIGTALLALGLMGRPLIARSRAARG